MRAIAAALALLLVTTSVAAQTPPSLRDEIAAADKRLFDAYNARDIGVVSRIFDPTLEFYHDRGGLADYATTIRQLKENFARTNSPRRELVPETLEVYPIANYGAIQLGAHRFCHEEGGKPDCGVFKFVHVWRKENGEWKLTRVISYDH